MDSIELLLSAKNGSGVKFENESHYEISKAQLSILFSRYFGDIVSQHISRTSAKTPMQAERNRHHKVWRPMKLFFNARNNVTNAVKLSLFYFSKIEGVPVPSTVKLIRYFLKEVPVFAYF